MATVSTISLEEARRAVLPPRREPSLPSIATPQPLEGQAPRGSMPSIAAAWAASRCNSKGLTT
jgi:hypothetical protein